VIKTASEGSDAQPVPCTYKCKPVATNQKYHLLSQHGIKDEKHDAIVALAAAKMQKIDEAMLTTTCPLRIRSFKTFFARATAATGAANCFWETPEVKQLLDAIQRNSSVSLEVDRRTVSDAVLSESTAELKRCLLARRGLVATLALDSGTVVNRYVFVCVHAPPFAPVLVAGVPDFDAEDGRLTTASLSKILHDVIAHMKEYDITIAGIVGDNAANVQAACRDVAVIQIRCLAHSLNLIYKEAVDRGDGEVSAAWRAAMKVHDANDNAPRLVETRWNYKWEWMEKVCTQVYGDARTRIYDVSMLSQTDCRRVKEAVEAFEVIRKHIDVLQGDGADFVSAVRAVAELHFTYALPSQRLNADMRSEIYAALVHHGSKLVNICTLVLSFFHPAFDRSKAEHEVVDAVKTFISNTGATLCNCPLSDMIGPFFAAMQDAPEVLPIDADRPWTTAEVVAFWMESSSTLRIASVLSKISRLAPTEASVEREFSKLKLIVDDRRTQLTAENAVAPCILRSCMRAARVETILEPREPSTYTRQHAEHTVKMWTVVSVRRLPAEQPKRTRQHTSTCNICHKSFGDHADDIAMTCNTCGSFFSPTCARIHPDFVDRANPVGRCLDCRKAKRHTTEARA
jgi:hypothetical protein